MTRIRPDHRTTPAEFFLRHVWLVYTIFFFIQPAVSHQTRQWIMLGVVFPLFFALYWGAGYTRGRLQKTLLAAMFLLGVAYTPMNEGASAIYVFSAAFVPYAFQSPRFVKVSLVFAALVLLAETLLFHLSFWATGFSILFIPVVGLINYASVQKRGAEAKLRMAHEEIEHLAKLAERERIARDMHDVLGHALSVVVLKSELAGRLVTQDPVRARREMTDVEDTARKALAEVREAIRGYRSEGLAAELERAQRTLDAAGVTLHCSAKPPSLAPAEETVVSLIVREAVTNIVRHAEASQCEMNFSNGNGRLLFTVRDDGRGCIRDEGNGLRGMRERVEALGGRFSIEAANGTELLIEIPVRA